MSCVRYRTRTATKENKKKKLLMVLLKLLGRFVVQYLQVLPVFCAMRVPMRVHVCACVCACTRVDVAYTQGLSRVHT